MTTISCIIIDDEPLAVKLMESYVTKTPFLELKGSFTSGGQAFEFIQDNPVDLLFCDIQMPGLNGMDLSKMLPEDTRIIFTTAFSQYAIEGFKVHALDYLLKPISYDDFLAAANHAKKVIDTERQSGTERTPPIRSIFVKTEYRLQQIELDSITFIEGLKDYVKIHLDDGSDPVLSLIRMKTLQEQLPKDRFVRVQKSYIVQLSKIEAIERSHIVIGKDRIPIGETYQEALLNALSGNSILPQ
ncbi:MAG: response regulator transcription factor [Bacteroidales bacterium]|nr:response regulator transcription factor [Bacteroidales bacterium]